MNQAQSDHIVVFVTAADRTGAERLARGLLEERLAACVNIISAADSHFLWRGNLQHAAESVLIVKTVQRLLPDVIETVKTLHSYEVPEIIALPIVGGSREYLEWIDAEVRPR